MITCIYCGKRLVQHIVSDHNKNYHLQCYLDRDGSKIIAIPDKKSNPPLLVHYTIFRRRKGGMDERAMNVIFLKIELLMLRLVCPFVG